MPRPNAEAQDAQSPTLFGVGARPEPSPIAMLVQPGENTCGAAIRVAVDQAGEWLRLEKRELYLMLDADQVGPLIAVLSEAKHLMELRRR